MRDALINMLAQKAGFKKIPQTQEEFLAQAMSNASFGQDVQRAETLGLIKRDERGNLNIIDQDRVKLLIQNFVLNFFK